MSARLNERLNQILPRITSADFLGGHGIGNEIAFYIFDYPPEDELRVREHVELLQAHIPKQKPGLKLVHVNLFDFLLDYLRERNLLEKSLVLQQEKGDDALHRALKGVLQEEKLARRFAELARPREHDLVLISGIGSAYPLLRAHTLLSCLHSTMGQTPLLLFYPGRYDKMTLRLFGKTGLSGDPAGDPKKTANYYRAFRLID
jgi:hypothetical protein